jgi:hypothetical protein
MLTRRLLDGAVALFGALSAASLLFFYLALSDIAHDYASPQVWAHAGQELPAWYSPVNRCPDEWRALQVGFIIVVVFHLLLLARALSRKPQGVA